MKKRILLTGAFFGGLAVILGAFGAHGLKSLVTAEAINSFETGVRYQMYHALLLLIMGAMPIISEKEKKAIFYLVFIGVSLFSGSIYLLSLNSLTTFDFKIIAFLTPIGGTFLIIAWLLLGIRFFRLQTQN